MNNFKISLRISAMLALLLLLLVGLGALGLKGISDANRGLETVYQDRIVPMGQLLNVQRLILRNRVAMNNAVALGTEEAMAANLKDIEENVAGVNQNWAAYMATSLTPEEAQLAETFTAVRADYLRHVVQPAQAAMRAHDNEALRKIVVENDNRYYAPVRNGIVKLTDLQLDEAKKQYEAGQARFASSRNLTIGMVVLAAALALALGVPLVRGIARGLQSAVDSMVAIAAGDLSGRITPHGKDEVSQLLHALADMQASLVRVVGSVREGSEAVASASIQIAQGNMDLSGRTESQASALEETAASMEELSSTVKQNADNARQASQLAHNASDVAQQGGQVVAQVVDTMQGISESSKKIADIISVIDGIAFQTNILALNAAVEAARAGEQGRGFAVVASEVRSLAGRSAEAAKQIKHLIDDSVTRVAAGTALVDSAGSTMQQVVGAIQRVNDIMTEISAASAEQSAGVNQVGEAVTQMDEDTQQNAALVEEMAAAAAALKTQAGELVQAVSVFRLGSGEVSATVLSLPRSGTRSLTAAASAPMRVAASRAAF